MLPYTCGEQPMLRSAGLCHCKQSNCPQFKKIKHDLIDFEMKESLRKTTDFIAIMEFTVQLTNYSCATCYSAVMQHCIHCTRYHQWINQNYSLTSQPLVTLSLNVKESVCIVSHVNKSIMQERYQCVYVKL